MKLKEKMFPLKIKSVMSLLMVEQKNLLIIRFYYFSVDPSIHASPNEMTKQPHLEVVSFITIYTVY